MGNGRKAGGLQGRHRRENGLGVEAAGPLEMPEHQVAQGALSVEVLVDGVGLPVEAQVHRSRRVVKDESVEIVGGSLHSMRAGPLGGVTRLHHRADPVEQGAVPLHDGAHVLSGQQEHIDRRGRADRGATGCSREHGDLPDERTGSEPVQRPLAVGPLADHDGLALADEEHFVAALTLAH